MSGQVRESLVKAGYIEKFTHFVQWPGTGEADDHTSEFIIAVIGQNSFGSDLNDIFSQVKVKDSIVKISYISSVDEIGNCMILFISSSERNNLDSILEYTTGKPILTIGDTRDFGNEGVIINLVAEDNYIKYEVNKDTLGKSGLIINSMLLNYAIIIRSDG